MMRLVGVGSPRIVSRRLVRLMVIGVFAMLTLIAVVQAAHHSSDVSGLRAQVQAELQPMVDQGGSFGVTCPGTPDNVGQAYQVDENGNAVLPPGCHLTTLSEAV